MTEKHRRQQRSAYSLKEILNWIELKEKIDDTGRKLGWKAVEEITGVNWNVMKNVVHQFKSGQRLQQREQREHAQVLQKKLLRKGVPPVKIAAIRQVHLAAVTAMFDRMGIDKIERKKILRTAVRRREVLVLTRERKR